MLVLHLNDETRDNIHNHERRQSLYSVQQTEIKKACLKKKRQKEYIFVI